MYPKILFGSMNRAKYDRILNILKPLQLDIRNLEDVNITQIAEEDGKSPEENAIKKADFYCKLAQLPTFAIDYGLHLDKFSSQKQPGVFVRRISKSTRSITDDEILAYYCQELANIGGESTGRWICAIALANIQGRIISSVFSSFALFTSRVSSILIPGEPLAALQYDPLIGKYMSEMTLEERMQVQESMDKRIFEFIEVNMKSI